MQETAEPGHSCRCRDMRAKARPPLSCSVQAVGSQPPVVGSTRWPSSTRHNKPSFLRALGKPKFGPSQCSWNPPPLRIVGITVHAGGCASSVSSPFRVTTLGCRENPNMVPGRRHLSKTDSPRDYCLNHRYGTHCSGEGPDTANGGAPKMDDLESRGASESELAVVACGGPPSLFAGSFPWIR